MRSRSLTLGAALLAVAVLLTTMSSDAAAPAGPAATDAKRRPTNRQIPVGVGWVNNQVLRSRKWVYAIRFVLDRNTRMWRFFSGFNLEGLSAVGGRSGYTDGTGGRIRASLVAVDERGRPEMKRVLASETVAPAERYEQTRAAYGIRLRTFMLHFNMRGVKLKAGRLYAMTYRNVARRPKDNWFSTNSPTVKASEAGPNGRNTLHPRARGAIAGLDPREAVAWSTNRGRRWVWGRKVGRGNIYGAYEGSRTNDGGTRLPWYGWQSGSRKRPKSNQPYHAYRGAGSYTVTSPRVPRRVRLTEAGGYAPVGSRVGAVTVTNTRTGKSGRTGYLGGGIASGPLRPPVRLRRGDSYTLSNSGTVLKAEGDLFLKEIFGLRGRFAFRTDDNGDDRAELFALPHPWFR